MAGLYLHIPFCKQACHYCDFHFSTSRALQPRLVRAIQEELIMRKNYIDGETIHTIYFGGGTPSLLTHEEFAGVMDTIRQQFAFADQVEVTVEANPDDLTIDKLQHLWTSGVNRLSIGIQSFHDHVLEYFNRSHNAATARRCMEDARTIGFNNISIDLIYAVPVQTHEEWLYSIECARSLNPQHISAYSLTIEEGTAFGTWQRKGKLKHVEEEEAATDLTMLIEALDKSGYMHYEVSNFAKPGYYSNHNTGYWQSKKYLGIGPSAHSYNGESRQYTVSNNHAYVKAVLEEHRVPFELEELSREDHVNEYILTTLRTMWGCNLNVLQDRYQYDVLSEHRDYLDTMIAQQIAVLEDSTLKLTQKGLLLADKIASDLFLLP